MSTPFSPRLALLAAVLAMAATACGKGDDSSPATPPDPAPPRGTEDDLDRYARQLVAEHPDFLADIVATRRTSPTPEMFRTEFIAQSGYLVSVQDAAARDQITKDWTKAYCTQELRDLLAVREAAAAYGVLKDPFGTRQHVASCAATPAQLSEEDALPPLQDVGGFSTADICRAGFAVSFGRTVSIMQATNRPNYVQIDYRRPTDGKPFSFRCRLQDSHILSWDNRIHGARWYGTEPTDWKVRFAVSGKKLTISTFAGNATIPSKTGSFTAKELLMPPTPPGQSRQD